MLQAYLNTLIQTCASLKPCPLSKNRNKKALIEFSTFFEDDIIAESYSKIDQTVEQPLNGSIPNSPKSENSEE
jgi:hypothetical protein